MTYLTKESCAKYTKTWKISLVWKHNLVGVYQYKHGYELCVM